MREKLRWVLTRTRGLDNCPDTDGMALDGDVEVGRVYQIWAGPETGRWFWSMYMTVPGVDRREFACSGRESSKEKAKDVLALSYAEHLRRAGLGAQPVSHKGRVRRCDALISGMSSPAT